MASVAGKPFLHRLRNQEENKEKFIIPHFCSWSAPYAMIYQDCSAATYFQQSFAEWYSLGNAALLTGNSKQINHDKKEAQGEETTKVNEKAVFEKLCEEVGYVCLWERERKCRHAVRSVPRALLMCLSPAAGAPAPLVLWGVQNPRRQGDFPACQDASLCTKITKMLFTLGIPATT